MGAPRTGRWRLLGEIELAETDRWLAGPDAADAGFDPALVDLAMASRASIDQARAGHELARLITALSSTGT